MLSGVLHDVTQGCGVEEIHSLHVLSFFDFHKTGLLLVFSGAFHDDTQGRRVEELRRQR